MSSYGRFEIPTGAQFGVYDLDNGEWAGRWFADRESARDGVHELPYDTALVVCNVHDAQDFFEPVD